MTDITVSSLTPDEMELAKIHAKALVDLVVPYFNKNKVSFKIGMAALHLLKVGAERVTGMATVQGGPHA